MPTTVANVVSLAQMAPQAPALSERMLKHWWHVNLGGFQDRYAVKIGRHVLVDQAAVEAWLDAHRSKTAEEQDR